MSFKTNCKYIKSLLLSGFVAASSTIMTSAASAAECNENMDCQSSWLSLTPSEKETVFEFAEDYKAFMDKARTELTFVAEAIKIAEANGFEPLRDDSPMTPGAKYYDNNRDRAISMIVIGEEDFSEGLHVIGAHIDSPRLELKNVPLYAKGEFALFQTNHF